VGDQDFPRSDSTGFRAKLDIHFFPDVHLADAQICQSTRRLGGQMDPSLRLWCYKQIVGKYDATARPALIAIGISPAPIGKTSRARKVSTPNK